MPLRTPYQHAVIRDREDQARTLAELGASTEVSEEDRRPRRPGPRRAAWWTPAGRPGRAGGGRPRRPPRPPRRRPRRGRAGLRRRRRGQPGRVAPPPRRVGRRRRARPPVARGRCRRGRAERRVSSPRPRRGRRSVGGARAARPGLRRGRGSARRRGRRARAPLRRGRARTARGVVPGAPPDGSAATIASLARRGRRREGYARDQLRQSGEEEGGAHRGISRAGPGGRAPARREEQLDLEREQRTSTRLELPGRSAAARRVDGAFSGTSAGSTASPPERALTPHRTRPAARGDALLASRLAHRGRDPMRPSSWPRRDHALRALEVRGDAAQALQRRRVVRGRFPVGDARPGRRAAAAELAARPPSS